MLLKEYSRQQVRFDTNARESPFWHSAQSQGFTFRGTVSSVGCFFRLLITKSHTQEFIICDICSGNEQVFPIVVDPRLMVRLA